MRVVGGFFLSLFSISISFAASPDGHSCNDWLAYIGVQHQIALLKADQKPVPTSLWKTLFELENELMHEDLPAAEEDEFLASTHWMPETNETEGGERDPEPESEDVSASPYFSLEQQLARLEDHLAEKVDTDFSHDAVDAVFRRMLAARHFKDQKYQNVFIAADMTDPTLQILSLEFASSNVGRGRVVEFPSPERIKSFATTFQLPSSEALRMLEFLDFNRIPAKEPAELAAMRETVTSIARDRLNLPPHTVVRILKRVFETQKDYPVHKFGKLLFYVVGTRDELYSIYDSKSLIRYLEEAK